MISFAAFLGNAQTVSFGSNTDLNLRKGRRVRALATAGSLKLRLPVATGLQLGGPYAIVSNDGSNAFDLCDSAGTVVKNVPTGKGVVVGLADNSTAAGVWGAVRLAVA